MKFWMIGYVIGIWLMFTTAFFVMVKAFAVVTIIFLLYCLIMAFVEE